ncbi:MAG: hypothetical protein KDD62_14025, partial [Bdellovibrionales bacterium]|nr:hypothetical protein [Bdellovibrionales bacterium]
MLIDEESIAAAWKSLLKSERSKGQIVYVPHGAERPVRFSREQIFRLALQICNALHRKLEVPKFGRVALLAGADPNATAICHGCWLGNFSLVLVDPKASIERLIAVINNAEVDTVFFSMAHMMTMSKLIKSCAGVRHWVLTEGSGLNGHGTSLHVLANLLGD